MLQSKYLKLVKHDNYAKLRTTIQLLNSKGTFICFEVHTENIII